MFQLWKDTRKEVGADPNFFAVEMRIVSIDDPEDVGIVGAESPAFGQFHPVQGRPDMNVAVVVEIASSDILNLPGDEIFLKFLITYEKKLMEYFRSGDGEEAVLRVEWSKGWGFSDKGPNTDRAILKCEKEHGKVGPWDFAIDVLKKYDPWGIYASNLTDMILGKLIRIVTFGLAGSGGSQIYYQSQNSHKEEVLGGASHFERISKLRNGVKKGF
ncbi:unnamed protein product [Allacma fusca]|uniref:Cholesterol oxidase substrate-binding domain-containing protein n=1 Tax=Allacma fusca TaxID=39272 RepID=A0A8J2PSY6_9HEXA|nr:unnamed protein product [Allacma fusca]